jgi:hypothetical protein
VLDRFVLPAGEALAAREVVKKPGVLGVGFAQLASPVGGLGVLARLVERAERRPELPADGFVCPPGRSPECDDRCPRLLRKRRPLDARACEDEGASGRVHAVTVELEPRASSLDEVELLLPGVRLIVLVDDPVARVAGGPGVTPKDVIPKWAGQAGRESVRR